MERKIIEGLENETRPVQILGDHESVDDSQRMRALALMNQRRMNSPHRLTKRISSNEIPHTVAQSYTDSNEIRNLFRMLKTPEARRSVLGFETYGAMHSRFRTRAAKMAYMKRLENKKVCNS